MRISDWSSDVCSSDLLTRPARVPAEINQRDIIALSIRRMDAERRTSAAARVVIDGRKLNGNDAARIGHIKLRHTLPVDPARREVEGQIDGATKAKALQWLCERRTDAFQNRDFGKERIENIGSHGSARL